MWSNRWKDRVVWKLITTRNLCFYQVGVKMLPGSVEGTSDLQMSKLSFFKQEPRKLPFLSWAVPAVFEAATTRSHMLAAIAAANIVITSWIIPIAAPVACIMGIPPRCYCCRNQCCHYFQHYWYCSCPGDSVRASRKSHFSPPPVSPPASSSHR